GREGLMRLQGGFDRGSHGLEGGILQRAIAEAGREAGGHEPYVPLPQGQVQLLRQAQNEPAAGRGAAELDEPQMARRDIGAEGELHLGQPPALAPESQMIPEAFAVQPHGMVISSLVPAAFYLAPLAEKLPFR